MTQHASVYTRPDSYAGSNGGTSRRRAHDVNHFADRARPARLPHQVKAQTPRRAHEPLGRRPRICIATWARNGAPTYPWSLAPQRQSLPAANAVRGGSAMSDACISFLLVGIVVLREQLKEREPVAPPTPLPDDLRKPQQPLLLARLHPFSEHSFSEGLPSLYGAPTIGPADRM